MIESPQCLVIGHFGLDIGHSLAGRFEALWPIFLEMSGATHLLILNHGGVRSLVATALAQGDEPKPRLTLLYVDDGRDSRATRRAMMRRQSAFLGISRVTELSMPHLYGHGHGRAPDGGALGLYVRGQLLLAAMAEARQQQAEAVVWPVSVAGDVKQAALATEQAVLCEHLAQAEAAPSPRIDTPLAELTDQQVIELGEQLGVDWGLTWSCIRPGESPCQACSACRRRQQAFDKAGVVDTLLKPVGAKR